VFTELNVFTNCRDTVRTCWEGYTFVTSNEKFKSQQFAGVLDTILLNSLHQGGSRLRAWRATLRFEKKFAGRKERNSTAIKRLVCCSNKLNLCCTPNAIFDYKEIFKFSVCLFVCDSKYRFSASKKDIQNTNKLTKQFFVSWFWL